MRTFADRPSRQILFVQLALALVIMVGNADAAELKIVVRDARGEPFPLVPCQASPLSDETPAEGHTGVDGRVAFTALPEGYYNISCSAQGEKWLKYSTNVIRLYDDASTLLEVELDIRATPKRVAELEQAMQAAQAEQAVQVTQAPVPSAPERPLPSLQDEWFHYVSDLPEGERNSWLDGQLDRARADIGAGRALDAFNRARVVREVARVHQFPVEDRAKRVQEECARAVLANLKALAAQDEAGAAVAARTIQAAAWDLDLGYDTHDLLEPIRTRHAQLARSCPATDWGAVLLHTGLASEFGEPGLERQLEEMHDRVPDRLGASFSVEATGIPCGDVAAIVGRRAAGWSREGGVPVKISVDVQTCAASAGPDTTTTVYEDRFEERQVAEDQLEVRCHDEITYESHCLTWRTDGTCAQYSVHTDNAQWKVTREVCAEETTGRKAYRTELVPVRVPVEVPAGTRQVTTAGSFTFSWAGGSLARPFSVSRVAEGEGDAVDHWILTYIPESIADSIHAARPEARRGWRSAAASSATGDAACCRAHELVVQSLDLEVAYTDEAGVRVLVDWARNEYGISETLVRAALTGTKPLVPMAPVSNEPP